MKISYALVIFESSKQVLMTAFQTNRYMKQENIKAVLFNNIKVKHRPFPILTALMLLQDV